MSNFSNLEQGLLTGFIDKSIISSQDLRPSLLINNYRQGKKVLTTINRELESCEEFWFSVAFVTTSGLAVLMNSLILLEKKNIKGKILASQYLNFTQPEALRRIKKFKNIELKIATEGSFHSKGYLFKRGEMFNLIVGSSNLTQSALCSNIELNLKICATENSELIEQSISEFDIHFFEATDVTDAFLNEYEIKWKAHKKLERDFLKNSKESNHKVIPNLMQKEALFNIQKLRENGSDRALLISATGTGKTYLSAFDVQEFNPKKFLFVVHRRTIAEEAMKTFKALLGNQIKMGMYSGYNKNLEADYLFSTVQTISKSENLQMFDDSHFDYIVIDETHRAGAKSYLSIINYFKPKFLLGMTATPERTDGADIFKLFNYKIAYEIRLHRALEEKMLSPFHYYGVTDLTINGEEVDDKAEFNKLVAEERLNRIIEKIEIYGCDDGNVRGLIFCSRNEIAEAFSTMFNERGFRTLSLSGKNSEIDRQEAIQKLESDDLNESLDYIFTVDIFNEGIDIPKVNQIIMLRPTQSAIIFVQQLGRGLRKVSGKEYLTVIDFIGNYENNYLVPIALYGDKTYNKDTLRKLISSESSFIPGNSSINFDQISKGKIFESINKTNLSKLVDLKSDYFNLKNKLGKIPLMVDFQYHGSRDPFHFVSYSKSYYNFISKIDDGFKIRLNKNERLFIEMFSQEICNGKRVEESYLIKLLLKDLQIQNEVFINRIKNKYGYTISKETLGSLTKNLNFSFIRNEYDIIINENRQFKLGNYFKNLLRNKDFKTLIFDVVEYSVKSFENKFQFENFVEGFLRYQKYSRKDVCRILNWPLDISSTLYGYRTNESVTPCFVTYHKSDGVEMSIDYNDHFIDRISFAWESRSNRRIESNEIQNVVNSKRILLFIKKEDGEGTDFYFIGDCTIKDGSIKQDKMKDGKPVVNFTFILDKEVDEDIFNYLIA